MGSLEGLAAPHGGAHRSHMGLCVMRGVRAQGRLLLFRKLHLSLLINFLAALRSGRWGVVGA